MHRKYVENMGEQERFQKTRSQRILTKGRIACRAVIIIRTEWSHLLRTPQHSLRMLLNGPRNPQNCPFLFPRGSLDPLESALETASRSVHPFLQCLPECQQTDTQTYHAMYDTCRIVAIGHIYAMHAMWCKNIAYTQVKLSIEREGCNDPHVYRQTQKSAYKPMRVKNPLK